MANLKILVMVGMQPVKISMDGVCVGLFQFS